jgi:hypothetical protein
MNKLWVTRTMTALLLLGVVASCGSKDEASAAAGANAKAAAAKPSVLARIESWKRPGAAADSQETYDYIKSSLDLKAAAAAANMPPPAGTESAMPLPPTLIDTFASDVQMVAFYSLGMGKLDARAVTLEQVKQVIALYAKGNASSLAGYRPETHKTFVDSLSADERDQLAQELVDRIHDQGFLGNDSIGDQPARPIDEKAAVALGIQPAAAAVAAPATGGTPAYAGTYKSTFGRLVLEQPAADPTTITGRYSKGTVACTADGDNLACSWDEGGSSKGLAKFTRHHNGDISGRWGLGKNASAGGKWTMVLVKRDAMY